MNTLDLFADPVDLTAALVDIESPSHHEEAIADAVEGALRALADASGDGAVDVQRIGNTVVARTHFGREQRVVLAGHIDTVPLADNTPHRIEGDTMFGCGTVDMKSGMACYLGAFARLVRGEAEAPGERSASTSNRNFEGRQGPGGRTHLVSPLVAAATAITGHLASPADL